MMAEYGSRVDASGNSVLLTKTQEEYLGDIGPQLGCGAFACAYELGTDGKRVVKFTTDPFDAGAALDLTQRASPDAVRVYDVVHLKRPNNLAIEAPVFAIIAERVKTLSADDRQLLSKTTGHVVFDSFEEQGILDTTDFYNPTVLRSPVGWTLQSGHRKQLALICKRSAEDGETTEEHCNNLVKEALDVVEGLANRGIVFADAHGGNFGRRGKKLVALELGLSGKQNYDQVKTIAGLPQNRLRRKQKPFELIPRKR